MLKIKRYEKKDEVALFDLIRSEGEEWRPYWENAVAVNKYRVAVENSIVYVAYERGVLCGYLRATDDFGYGIYVNDLLVHKNHRGNSYGKRLIERLCKDTKGTVYVMSDVDEYYKKQGYDKVEGRIIIVRE
jgi:GNAT superfamily N-acetyltransferase